MIERVLAYKKTTLAVAVAATLVSIYPMARLGWEFMPELDEGSFLFMPVTFPGLSVTKAGRSSSSRTGLSRKFRRSSP